MLEGMVQRDKLGIEAMNKVMYSSKSDEWETPQELFNRLDTEYHFDRDVCATAENRKCAEYYSVEQDGLKQDWHGTLWMNPPYGRKIPDWIEKAYNTAKSGGVLQWV